jgi:hypothetical protein
MKKYFQKRHFYDKTWFAMFSDLFAWIHNDVWFFVIIRDKLSYFKIN